MKKILVIEIIALALVLTVLGAGVVYFSFFAPPSTEPVSTLSDDVTVAPTQAPTAPVNPDQDIPDAESIEDWSGWSNIPDSRQIDAKNYFIYDLQTDTFLTIAGEKNQRIYPASITKLVTALVALEYLDTGDMVQAGSEVKLIHLESSTADIPQGAYLSVSQLVEGMLLPSGNDAAYILATAAGRKILGGNPAEPTAAIEAFVKQMNRWAEEKGLIGSHFMNPDGIHHDEHYMTLEDLALLGKLSVESITVRYYASLANGSNPAYDPLNTDPKAPKQWRNTNAMLHEGSDFYCPYATGLKTGFTTEAGNCLLSGFQYGTRRYVVGVFGCTESEYRFVDTLQLFLHNVVQTQ